MEGHAKYLTPGQAGISRDVKAFIILQTLRECGSAESVSLGIVLQACAIQSHTKPTDEVWRVGNMETSVHGPVRGTLSTWEKKKKNWIVYEDGQHRLLPAGEKVLELLKKRLPREIVAHHSSIICRAVKKEKEILKLRDAFSKIALEQVLPESEKQLRQRYFDSGTGKLCSNLEAALVKLGLPYMVSPRTNATNKTVLWIGLFSNDPAVTTESIVGQCSELNSADIEVDILTEDQKQSCSSGAPLSRTPHGKSFGTLGFIGCAEGIPYAVTNFHVVCTEQEEGAGKADKPNPEEFSLANHWGLPCVELSEEELLLEEDELCVASKDAEGKEKAPEEAELCVADEDDTSR